MEQIIELHSETINNNILKLIDRTIKQYDASYRIIKINFEDPEQDKVYIKLAVDAEGDKFEKIRQILTKTTGEADQQHEVTILKPSLKDATAPPDFYSTSNHPTEVFIDGEWLNVKNIRMDALLVLRDGEIYATQLRDIKKGDLIVCTSAGVRVKQRDRQEEAGEFAFMTNEVSSERHVELEVRELAKKMKDLIGRGGKVYVVAGPVVIHTGGMIHFQDIIRKGYVSGLLSGNALAVHDIEFDLLGTSLGIDLNTGNAVPGGHSHHLRAINAVNISGSIADAVADGTISGGMFLFCGRKISGG
ncbi:MAG: TIGR00300 family protein, partial [Clostridiaceae bacterium]|nr:TIGR00300 family protein [Clostridiaceae bacterium]